VKWTSQALEGIDRNVADGRFATAGCIHACGDCAWKRQEVSWENDVWPLKTKVDRLPKFKLLP